MEAPPLTPYIVVSDAAAAIEFYKDAFGAVEIDRHLAPGSPKIMHARLEINGGTLMLADDFSSVMGGACMTPPALGGSVRDMIESFARAFIQEVAATKRGDIVRLIVAEGPRFPDVADFYYREVVSRGLSGMRALIELGIARGEIAQKNLARFPQLLVAPAIVAVIWQSLFSKHAALDANEMFRVHLDLIFGERRAA